MPILDLREGRTQLVATHYRATEFLEEGRFAEVYRAHYKRDGVDVALKLYKEPIVTGKTEDRARREYEVLRKLADLEFFPARPSYFAEHFNRRRHPVVVMELGEYRWTEEAEGEGPKEDRMRWHRAIVPLNQVLPTMGAGAPKMHRPEFWEPNTLAEWVSKLCDAVQFMHERNVLHLDLKPENILLKRAAGAAPVPFLIDFNTSASSDSEPFTGGTAGYQAPEVRTGARKKPDRADDLYALGLVLWEVHFGLGSRDHLHPSAQPHALVPYAVDAVRAVLLRALTQDPLRRFLTATDLKQALAGCLQAPAGLSDQEMAYIRKEAQGVREDFEEFLAGQYYLHVSKAKRDEVASLFSSLPTETTDSQDLRDRLLSLGPRGIAAIVEESYKLDPASPQFATVVDVLATLSANEQARIQKGDQSALKDRGRGSIEQYCLSSTYVVRRLCRDLCLRLELLPPILRESLLTDQMIYLPEERDELVDLLIQLGKDSDALRTLTRYLYNEYLEDPGFDNYVVLRDRVAARIPTMKVQDKASFLVDEAIRHGWEDGEIFPTLDDATQRECAKGLLQLLGDAFAFLEEEALEALKSKRVPGLCPKRRLPIWRTFTTKLSRRYEPARIWLEEVQPVTAGVTAKQLDDTRRNLNRTDPTGNVDVRAVFGVFLRTGEKSALKLLVWSGRLDEVLALASQALQGTPDAVTAQRVFDLLRGCDARQRSRVLEIAFDHYETFATLNYSQLLRVVCQNGLPATWMRERMASLLVKDIDRPERSGLAQEWLDDLLARE